MSRGPAGLILWLAPITVGLVLDASLFALLAGTDPDKDLAQMLWNILYQTLTPTR